MFKKDKEKTEEKAVEETVDPKVEEKKELLALYDKLIELKIDRISDLTNKIANCK